MISFLFKPKAESDLNNVNELEIFVRWVPEKYPFKVSQTKHDFETKKFKLFHFIITNPVL